MSVKMLSDMNTTMMEIERVDREGDRLKITGLMMGNFPAEIYVEAGDLLAIAKLHLRPSPLGFVLGLPVFWLLRYWKKPENQSLVSRTKGVLLFLGGTAVGLVGIFLVAMGVWAVLRQLF